MATTDGSARSSGGGVATASASGAPGRPVMVSAGAAAAAAGAGGAGGAGSASQSASQEPRWKGRHVKRFKLIDELGEGAMGRVYLAEDTVLKRHVALKLLPARHRDGRPNHRTERLVREARSAASLEHPHVIAVHEIDECGGVHYIAMELAEGGNLEKLVQLSGPMEVERACQLIAEAAEALGHAHQRGIVHRDVKPANLLLTRSGRCKVCDFGLAMFEIEVAEADAKTRCVGTPYFIAPEVAMGKGATPSSDLYSLGCTLWFLLTGRQPYAGTSAREVMKQHVSAPLPDVRKWRPDVPERLWHAIAQTCAKDPSARFESAEHFAKVMRTFTIPTGSGSHGAMQPLSHDGNGSGSVLVVTPSGAMAPVSAAQLEAILPHGAGGGSSRLHVPTAILWTLIGTGIAVLLIGVGIWMARQGPNSVMAGSSGAGEAEATATLATTSGGLSSTSTATELLPNGSLDELTPEGDAPASWYVDERCRPFVTTLTENGNRFLRLTNQDPDSTVHVAQRIEVDPSWRAITVSARMRAMSLKTGKTAAQDARVAFAFRDASDKRVGPWPPVPNVKEDSGWVTRAVTADVPSGAKTIYIQLALLNATGTVDFDDVQVVPQK